MLPVIPTTSGVNRRRHRAPSAPSAAQPVGHLDDGHVAERLERAGVERPADDERRGPGGDRPAQELVAVRALAGQRDEHLAGLDQRESTAPPRMGRSLERRRRPLVMRAMSAAENPVPAAPPRCRGSGSLTPGSVA